MYSTVFQLVGARLFPCLWQPSSCLLVRSFLIVEINATIKIAPGSTTCIIVPLTTIGQQLKDLCDKHGVTAVLSSEVWIRVPSKNDVSLLDRNTLCINNGEENYQPSFVQLGPGDLARELMLRPRVVIMSAEFLAAQEVKFWMHPEFSMAPFCKVRDTILNCGLSPAGRRPVVCIDEAQVFFSNLQMAS